MLPVLSTMQSCTSTSAQAEPVDLSVDRGKLTHTKWKISHRQQQSHRMVQLVLWRHGAAMLRQGRGDKLQRSTFICLWTLWACAR
jgi:hypothetical protein